MTAERLLVLACSATKVAGLEALPAWRRYDGPAWRTLRAFLARSRAELVDAAGVWELGDGSRLRVLALSAELGAIPAGLPIADYDRRMTAERAFAFAAMPGAFGRELLAAALEVADRGLLWGGAVYVSAAVGLLGREAEAGRLELARGRGIGDLLGRLKSWLGALEDAERFPREEARP